MGTNGNQAPYIEFKDVSKSFGDNRVLDDVSFKAMPEETLCILGRSGVGKSVSLHHIMGFLKPDSGRVIVAYEDITDYPEPELERIRKKVTMVFQNGALFDSLSVGENVAFPLRERRELSEEQIYQIVDGLLEMVGVKEMRDLFPAELSTGMKRSVAIARALAAQPECVLYDEPTTMVDPLMAQLLGDLIERLKIQLHLTSFSSVIGLFAGSPRIIFSTYFAIMSTSRLTGSPDLRDLRLVISTVWGMIARVTCVLSTLATVKLMPSIESEPLKIT